MEWFILAAIGLLGLGGALWWRGRGGEAPAFLGGGSGPEALQAQAYGWRHHVRRELGEAGRKTAVHQFEGVTAMGQAWRMTSQSLTPATALLLWRCEAVAQVRHALVLLPTDSPPRPSVLPVATTDGPSLALRRMLGQNFDLHRASLGELPWDRAYLMFSDDPTFPFQVLPPRLRRELVDGDWLEHRLEMALGPLGLYLRLEHAAGDPGWLGRLAALGESLAAHLASEKGRDVIPLT